MILRAERNFNEQNWLRRLIGRCNKNVAAVALANKNARIVWALLAKDERFRFDYAAA
jgi:transposase